MHVIRTAGIALVAVLVAASPALAVEQATPSCPDYHGITCDGWVTDAAGVLTDETAVEAAAGRLVAAHDHEVAVVVAADSDGLDPHDFAAGLGDAWGVGDPARNDGIVVLVSLAERRTEIVTGDGLTIDGLDSVAESGNAYFADGDFSGGLIAIITTLDARLSGVPAGGGESDGGGSGIFRLVVAGGIMASGLYLVGGTRRRQTARVRSARTAKVDDVLDELEPAGDDLPTISEYALARPGGKGDIATKVGVAALRDLADGRVPGDDAALKGLWRWGLVEVVDKKKLLADAAEPLELKVSQERDMLESGVQAAVKDALGVGRSAEDLFKVRLDELESLVQALRPHRIAEARRHTAETLADSLTETPIGAVGVTDLGTRLVEVAPALEGDQPVTDSITEMDGAFHTAEDKADRLADPLWAARRVGRPPGGGGRPGRSGRRPRRRGGAVREAAPLPRGAWRRAHPRRPRGPGDRRPAPDEPRRRERLAVPQDLPDPPPAGGRSERSRRIRPRRAARPGRDPPGP